MCEKCQTANSFGIDIEAEVQAYADNLAALHDLFHSLESLTQKDQRFADDLLNGQYGFRARGALTAKQWGWVHTLLGRAQSAAAPVEIEGDFSAIQVMFRLASSNDKGLALKNPKIRLLSDEGRFVQLNLKPGTSKIDVYVDGWAGHGYRKYAGSIVDDKLRPYGKDRMSDDVVDVIRRLAKDPYRTAKAMAKLLGVCMYCGQRLSDDRSKSAGYGPVCADNWGLPWGK